MEVRYSAHLRLRLKVRGIPENLPRLVYLRSKRRFFDLETDLEIAVHRTLLFGKRRDVAVTYKRFSGGVILVTIHPLKTGQLENRVRSGRWRKQ